MSFSQQSERWLRIVDTAIGRPVALALACLLVIAWALSGPAMHFSNTWQLLINTPTMVITYLIVFTLQNAKNTGQKAMHAKIDELLLAVGHGHERELTIEDQPQPEIDRHRDARSQRAR